MKYRIYKMKFTTPVHFGAGRLSGSVDTLYADTLFSALCHEALLQYGEAGIEKLYQAASEGQLQISDLLPYKESNNGSTEYYIPKPFVRIEHADEGDSKLKKKFKGLKYIQVESLAKFVEGKYVPGEENTEFGEHNIRGNAKIVEGDDAKPFSVGNFTFTANEEFTVGLYLIVGTADDELQSWFEGLMNALSYSGIGGERSSGYGKFSLETVDKMPTMLEERLKGDYSSYMSISISMAADDELQAVVDGAGYELIKRGGFVSSGRATSEVLKKKDMYCFKAGASFKNKFNGCVFDVSAGTEHPVYRYAKPMLIGIIK